MTPPNPTPQHSRIMTENLNDVGVSLDCSQKMQEQEGDRSLRRHSNNRSTDLVYSGAGVGTEPWESNDSGEGNLAYSDDSSRSGGPKKPKKSVTSKRSPKSSDIVHQAFVDDIQRLAGENDALCLKIKLLEDERNDPKKRLESLRNEASLDAYLRVAAINDYASDLLFACNAPPPTPVRLKKLKDAGSLPRILFAELPRDLWSRYLPDWILSPSAFGYTGWLNNWFDPYRHILMMRYEGLVLGTLLAKDDRPHHDKEEVFRDGKLIMIQPVLSVYVTTGEVFFLYSNVSVAESARKWFRPTSLGEAATIAGGSNPTRFQIEAVCGAECDPVDVDRINSFDSDLSRLLGGAIIFKVLYVSAYTLIEIFCRRVRLTPKLDVPTQISRLIRTYGEDPCVDMRLDFRSMYDIDVMRDTANVLAAFVSHDVNTPLADF